ncbi:hypothetical protein [Arcobacter defluvii]|uniref:Uncharacterized protein n=1 Tax=Arcobacter defluvii TaxID=873191 RepID=A0AAE7E850_9BACT|nr:hypothetical protein [Arcobacter defluvii]QKF78428.1 hypothetical protein ADFLV_2440 [Arcobacter defluvii]RXI30788.1 hypothetical protein CP964_11080 [Arcobacter defluvii]
MNLVSSKSKKIFLCSDTKINETSKVDIILSPEFYWVRIFDIPVKNISQARAVVPTLFEDLLQDVTDLSYQVIKLETNKYLCFAYINQKIYEAIKQSGINLSLVNSIYFAQNECKNFKQFYVDDKSFLYTQDEILVKIPKELLSEKVDLKNYIENINLSANRVDIKLYSNFLTSKQINMILAFCLIFIVINFSKYFIYSNEISNLDKKMQDIKISNNLPNSMIQIDSIISSNKKIAQKEINKREAIYYILSNNDFEIKNIELQNDILNIDFLNVNGKKLEEYISKKYKIISTNSSNLISNIKVQL